MQNLLTYHRHIDPPPEIYSFVNTNIKKDDLYDPNLKAYTSYPKYEICSELKPYYNKIIRRALFDLTLSFAKFEQSIWCQVYTPTGDSKHREHNHWESVDLSWVHFIKTPDKSCFRFKNEQTPPQNDGDFIMFPSWVVHKILPFTEGDDRIVVVGNVRLKDANYP